MTNSVNEPAFRFDGGDLRVSVDLHSFERRTVQQEVLRRLIENAAEPTVRCELVIITAAVRYEWIVTVTEVCL